MKKYTAYVGSYTYIGNSRGITILDVDPEKGTMTRRDEIDANNASYVSASQDNTHLYSIVDEGILTFESILMEAWSLLVPQQSAECAAAISPPTGIKALYLCPAIMTER
ncbi:MAG: beta-propeller fold lactonase family protein [Lachnospiraceae bacterium]